ncbi:MAG: NAD-dependent epimerase/dehydratase family protein, partial [Terrimicrobiaceae bacterium]
PASMRRAFASSRGFDMVVHAAGALSQNCLRVNHEGTRNLLSEIGARTGLWIQISSAGVYRNDLIRVVTEETECEQISEYERSKWLADQEVRKVHSSHIIVRPTMVAGIGMKGSPLRLFARAVGAGFVPEFHKDASLNLVHANDVAAAVLHFCHQAPPEGGDREYILSDDLLLNEVIGTIGRALHRSEPCRRIPDFLLKAAAGAGSAMGVKAFNRKRYAILNNRALFSSDRIRLLLPGWPQCGSRSAIDQVCAAPGREPSST